MIRFRCSDCGSDAVQVDAFASWNYAAQRWELDQTYDDAYCANCDSECHLEIVDEIVDRVLVAQEWAALEEGGDT